MVNLGVDRRTLRHAKGKYLTDFCATQTCFLIMRNIPLKQFADMSCSLHLAIVAVHAVQSAQSVLFQIALYMLFWIPTTNCRPECRYKFQIKRRFQQKRISYMR